MSAALREVGPSMAITSLTNCLAFGVGATTSTPILSLFCLATCIAMALDFIFELTFFGAMLVFSGSFVLLCQRLDVTYSDEYIPR